MPVVIGGNIKFILILQDPEFQGSKCFFNRKTVVSHWISLQCNQTFNHIGLIKESDSNWPFFHHAPIPPRHSDFILHMFSTHKHGTMKLVTLLRSWRCAKIAPDVLLSYFADALLMNDHCQFNLWRHAIYVDCFTIKATPCIGGNSSSSKKFWVRIHMN